MRRTVHSMIIAGIAVLLLANVSIAETAPKKVGFCIPEASTDKGWNEIGAVGIQKVADKYGFEVVLGEALGYGDIKPTARDMVGKGCELIIFHAAGYGTVAPEIARETGVKVVTCINPKDITPGLVSDYNFKSGEGGYLAGVLAGWMTRSNIVGICAAAEPTNFNRLSAGFVQGFKSVKPDGKLIRSLVGQNAYADAAGGKANTADLIAAGVDVVFGLGDGSSFGMLQSCTTMRAKDGGVVWFIDAIGDKRNVDKADIVLSSVLFDFSVVYEEIIQSMIDGTFGKQHWVSFPTGAIYLMEPNKAVPQDVIRELEAVQKRILNGELQIVDISVAADLRRFIQETFPREE